MSCVAKVVNYPRNRSQKVMALAHPGRGSPIAIAGSPERCRSLNKQSRFCGGLGREEAFQSRGDQGRVGLADRRVPGPQSDNVGP
jgi:hypothetical protein